MLLLGLWVGYAVRNVDGARCVVDECGPSVCFVAVRVFVWALATGEKLIILSLLIASHAQINSTRRVTSSLHWMSVSSALSSVSVSVSVNVNVHQFLHATLADWN